jgi:GntR family transcriptional regulator
MEIKLDFRSGIPIYIQIMDQIKQMIVSGQLPPGSQLSTVRKLATDLRVNFNTVARAYRLLDNAGLISTQQGRGTYILESPSEENLTILRQEALDGLTRQFLSECADLGCTADEVSGAVDHLVEEWKSGNRSSEPAAE